MTAPFPRRRSAPEGVRFVTIWRGADEIDEPRPHPSRGQNRERKKKCPTITTETNQS